MIWMDYNIESFASGDWMVRGEWNGELMGAPRPGTTVGPPPLYRPGDVFVVQPNGILKKVDSLTDKPTSTSQ
jgi:hypothetical protein